MKIKFYLYLIIFLSIILGVNASEQIKLSKDTYLPGETIQIEILLNFTPEKSLSDLNFQLLDKNNNKIDISLFSKELSKIHYLIYFDLLSGLNKGEYEFKIKDILYVEKDVLKKTSLSKRFQVHTFNSNLDYLIKQQGIEGSFNQDIQTTTVAAIVLKNSGYIDKADLAINWLLNQKDLIGCFPKDNCNVKDTAFALLALSSFNKDVTKTKNWLLDASNNFELGRWDLNINAGNVNGSCLLDGNKIDVMDGRYISEISNSKLNLDCSNLNKTVIISFNHSYLGNIYTDLFKKEGTKFNISIDNSGCYGVKYKTNCDYLTTAYVSWILKEKFQVSPSNYLKENPSETSTLDNALLYLITSDQDVYSWLLNNKQEDAWGEKSASISRGINNVYVSSFVVLALKKDPIVNDTIIWLDEQPNDNILDSAMKLYSYLEEKISPIISISPGFVESENVKVNLWNKNKYKTNVTMMLPSGVSATENSFVLEDKKVISISINKSELKEKNIKIFYDAREYNLPILIEIEAGKDVLIEKEAIELIGVLSSIKETFDKKETKQEVIRFKNNLNVPLHNIEFQLTKDLNEIISLERSIYSIIEPNETLQQILFINKEQSPKLNMYSGSLIINSKEGYKRELLITIEFKSAEEINKTKGNITSPPLEKPSNKKNILGWIIPFVIIIIIGVILFLRPKKPKKGTFEEYLKSKPIKE